MVAGSLREHLIAELVETGPIRFDRYMERALYDPQLGYYSRPGARVGRAGDFVTSPSLTPVFGRTLSRLVPLVRSAVGSPTRFRVVDAGAGEGQLLTALLGALSATAEGEGIEGVLIERSPALRERAAGRLARTGLKVLPLADAAEQGVPASCDGLILANELVDALPVRRLRRVEGRKEEAYVTVAEGELRELWVAGEPEGIKTDDLPDGRERCVAPALDNLVGCLSRLIDRGLLLFIDYGWPACLIDGAEGQGNALRGFRGGTLVPDLVTAPGEVDLTAHVDFTALHRAGIGAGLDTLFLTDQTYLLLGLGFLEDPDAAAARRLIHPEDLGGAFRCLGLGRGIDATLAQKLGLRDRRSLLGQPGQK